MPEPEQRRHVVSIVNLDKPIPFTLPTDKSYAAYTYLSLWEKLMTDERERKKKW
jgi:hypothetical protein